MADWLDIAGGIGKGLQTGANIIQQDRQQDRLDEVARQNMEIQRQNAEWQEQQRQRETLKQQRDAELPKLYIQLKNEMGGDKADPALVAAKTMETAAANGWLDADELATLGAQGQALNTKQTRIAFFTGDINGLNKALEREGTGLKIAGMQPTTNEYGQPDVAYVLERLDGGTAPPPMTRSSIGGLFGITDAYSTQKAALDTAHVKAKIGTEEAKQSYYKANAERNLSLADMGGSGTRTGGAGGRGTSNAAAYLMYQDELKTERETYRRAHPDATPEDIEYNAMRVVFDRRQQLKSPSKETRFDKLWVALKNDPLNVGKPPEEISRQVMEALADSLPQPPAAAPAKQQQQQPAAAPAKQQQQQPVEVKSKAEYDKLPAGTPVILPDGRRGVKK
jgi:hypothetical protein